MRKLSLLTLLSVCMFNFSFAQNMGAYSAYVEEAWQLYEAAKFEEAAEKYEEAFDQIEGKAQPNDRYNAACSYALANNADKAFYHLFYLADNPDVKYRNYQHITNDPDLKSLYGDERWEKLMLTIKENKDEYEKDLDMPLVNMLDTVYQEDQQYRKQISAIQEEYGWDSEEMQAHFRKIVEKDSINLIKVSKILDDRGWLGADVIGDRGNATLFLVIQHAGLETQEKYLPMMREAVKKGNARASSLALLEDRVALRKGEKQIYGSQIGRNQESGAYYVLPLKDPDHVDQRRSAVGLGPLADYIARWDIKWDVEAYKEKLPEYEAMQNQ